METKMIKFADGHPALINLSDFNPAIHFEMDAPVIVAGPEPAPEPAPEPVVNLLIDGKVIHAKVTQKTVKGRRSTRKG